MAYCHVPTSFFVSFLLHAVRLSAMTSASSAAIVFFILHLLKK